METKINEEKIISQINVPGGWNYSLIVKQGQTLRLTDIKGAANVSVLLFNAHNYSERFNLGDTLKIQHICTVAKNSCLYSDMGRVLMSVPNTSCHWHDVLCGTTHANLIEKRFGKKDYQSSHNNFYRNGYDSLIVEMGKYGMTRRDFAEVINFFSKVSVDNTGKMSFIENNSKAGDFVDLRAQMDTLVILDTGMHPLNPSKEYLQNDVEATLFYSPVANEDDDCFTWCDENKRGYASTKMYLA